ncbi:MAG: NAD(P)-binding domain-containing protein [Flavobacteriia bacterium]|nr:NAD(P)-binding domain-containing protein [Flavobacteriia bacterium]
MKVKKPTSIAIIGTGNVGRALAAAFSSFGYKVTFGVRNLDDYSAKEWVQDHPQIQVERVADAVDVSDVVIACFRPEGLSEMVKHMGDLENKVLIDAMNSIINKKTPFETTTHALEELTNCKNVVKCFNTTGAENLARPVFGRQSMDMFMAGDDAYAKEVARHLAKDIGFSECYDLGSSEVYVLMEQLAMVWIRLSKSELRREFGFKLLRR